MIGIARYGLRAILLAFASALCGNLCHAHSGGASAFATIAVQGTSLRYTLAVPLAALPPALAGADAATVPNWRPLLAVVERRVQVSTGGELCVPAPGVLYPPASLTDDVAVKIDYVCPREIRALTIRDDSFDVLGRDYHVFARIQWPGAVEQFVFEDQVRQAELFPGGSSRAGDVYGPGHVPSGSGFAQLVDGYGYAPLIVLLLLATAVTLLLGRWVRR